ncbi:MAG: hypothetical protein R3C68_04855 [Myxococcota bacterium]
MSVNEVKNPQSPMVMPQQERVPTAEEHPNVPQVVSELPPPFPITGGKLNFSTNAISEVLKPGAHKTLLPKGMRLLQEFGASYAERNSIDLKDVVAQFGRLTFADFNFPAFKNESQSFELPDPFTQPPLTLRAYPVVIQGQTLYFLFSPLYKDTISRQIVLPLHATKQDNADLFQGAALILSLATETRISSLDGSIVYEAGNVSQVRLRNRHGAKISSSVDQTSLNVSNLAFLSDGAIALQYPDRRQRLQEGVFNGVLESGQMPTIKPEKFADWLGGTADLELWLPGREPGEAPWILDRRSSLPIPIKNYPAPFSTFKPDEAVGVFPGRLRLKQPPYLGPNKTKK